MAHRLGLRDAPYVPLTQQASAFNLFRFYSPKAKFYLPLSTLVITNFFYLKNNRDSAAYVVEEMLEKYGRDKREAVNFCLVQTSTDSDMDDTDDGVASRSGPGFRDYYLDDDECPLSILMNHPPTRGKIGNIARVRFYILNSFFVAVTFQDLSHSTSVRNPPTSTPARGRRCPASPT